MDKKKTVCKNHKGFFFCFVKYKHKGEFLSTSFVSATRSRIKMS